MKKMCILLLLQMAALLVYSQRYEPVNPQKDKQAYEGYIIQLQPADFDTYGYSIYKDNELIIHQKYNPFTMSPVGLRKKEDVYKVAKWQIKELQNLSFANNSSKGRSGFSAHPAVKGHIKGSSQRAIPIKVAKELNISVR